MLRPAPADQWARLWLQSSVLMADAAMVMTLRGWRIMAGGRAASSEAERMIAEKLEAGFELAGALAAGKLHTPAAGAQKALDVYGRRIRANRRRLG